jgi:hypothetical protein
VQLSLSEYAPLPSGANPHCPWDTPQLYVGGGAGGCGAGDGGGLGVGPLCFVAVAVLWCMARVIDSNEGDDARRDRDQQQGRGVFVAAVLPTLGSRRVQR